MSYPEGLDVSLWQGDISNVLVGKRLCIVKISQAGFVDPKRTQHLGVARRLNVEWLGGYHWLDPEPTAAEQAALYLANAPADLDFHAVDVEGRILRGGPPYENARRMAREFIAYIHERDHRPILQYSSRGTWPGDNGQDGNWVADYTGDPNRTLLRLTGRGIPWVIWQYSDGGTKLDHDVFDPVALAKLCGRTTKPAPGATKVKYVQISAADAAGLDSIAIPSGTRIESFDGDLVGTYGPTRLRALPGLVDGHTNRRQVVVSTGRYYRDGIQRPTIQVAVFP